MASMPTNLVSGSLGLAPLATVEDTDEEKRRKAKELAASRSQGVVSNMMLGAPAGSGGY